MSRAMVAVAALRAVMRAMFVVAALSLSVPGVAEAAFTGSVSQDGGGAAAAPVFKPRVSAPPSISGVATVGATLTASTGTWDRQPDVISVRWERCAGECVAVATGTTYAVVSADVDATLRVVMTAANAGGEAIATSAPTETVTVAAGPILVTPPTVNGIARSGSTLSVSTGTWTNATSFARQWLRCDATGEGCSAVAGAVNATYPLTRADVGSTIRVRVTASGPDGSTTWQSAPTATIAPPPAPAATVLPAEAGTKRAGSTITATIGTWQYEPTSYRLQWQRCDSTAVSTCADIPDATGWSYVLAAADVSKYVRFRVTATNETGSTTASTTAAFVQPFLSVTFVAAQSTVVTSSSTVSPLRPTGVQAGDLLVLIIGSAGDGTTSWVPPTGWTTVEATPHATIFTRVATASEPTTYPAFGTSFPGAHSLVIAAYRNASDRRTSFDAGAEATEPLSSAPLPAFADTPRARYVALLAGRLCPSTCGSPSWSTGLTQRANASSSSTTLLPEQRAVASIADQGSLWTATAVTTPAPSSFRTAGALRPVEPAKVTSLGALTQLPATVMVNTMILGPWSNGFDAEGTPANATSRLWLRCDADGENCLPVARAGTYTPAQADVGRRLRTVAIHSAAVGDAIAIGEPSSVVLPR